MEIQKEIKKFDYKRLTKCVYGRAHDAIIGEWINWWTNYCPRNKKTIVHSVINPAIRARFRGKGYCADILFGEHSKKTDRGKDIDGVEREFFRIVGVAEIENDNSLKRLKHKVNSLYAYEKCRDKRHRTKFPDLEFGVLCTHYFDRDFEEKRHEIRKVKNYIKQKSDDSEMQWVLYLLRKSEIDDDYYFKVSGYARDPSRKSFYYDKTFFGKPLYCIFQRGSQLRIPKG